MRDLIAAIFAVVGTVSIWFNFLAYNAVASVILTRSSLHLSLLASFTTIFVAFIARPLGAYVFGLIGDKSSSKTSLVLTLTAMGLSTLLISMVTRAWYTVYELLMLRVIQGMALGGEWAAASVLTYESIRGGVGRLLTGMIQLGIPLGMLLTALAVIQWRSALLVGSLLSLSSAMIILALARGSKPIKWRPTLSIEDFKRILKAVGVKFGESSSFYVYTSAFLIYVNEHEIPSLITVAATSLLAFTLLTSIVLVRADPARVLIIGYVLFSLVNALMFRLQPLMLFALFGLVDAIAYTPQSLYLVSLFRSDIKHVGAGVSYHVASSLGGLMTYIISLLISMYGFGIGFVMMPILLVVSCIVSIVTLMI